jgi:hypothetical protein
MRSATLKGLAIHTADEAGNEGPDYRFGWGLMNTRKAAEVISNRNVKSFIQENELSDGSTYTFKVEATGTEPLKVTMAWTDPKATPVEPQLDPRDKMLVNDLDMTVTKGSNTFQPFKLDPENPSDLATTGDNNVDNVEQVLIENASSGTYTITIDHDGTLTNGSQEYSLIVTGIQSDFAPKTDSVYKIGQDTALIDAEVVTNSKLTVTERGIAYSTEGKPTISDNTSISGSGTGVFTAKLESLTPYKKYYARAYLETENGVIYGNTLTFKTLPWDVDAKADSITDPVKLISTGDEEIKINVKNIGFNNLTSLDIDWSIDGAAQTTMNWTGNVKQDSTVEVSVGTYNFTNTGMHEIAVSITNANGIADPNTDNNNLKDSVEVIAAGQLFEDFEMAEFVPQGWSQPNASVQWERAGSDFFVQIEGHDAIIGQDTDDPSQKLITPQLTVNSSSPNLEFSVAGGNNLYNYGSSKLQIKYSSDGSTWKNLGEQIDLADFGALNSSEDRIPQSFSYKVDSMTSGDYYFAFEASSNFSYQDFKSWLVIDNIKGPTRADLATNDLMVTKRKFVQSFVSDGETVNLPVKIINNTTTNESNIDVTLSVNNSTVETKTITETIGYLESGYVEFEWQATEGVHNFEITIPNDDVTDNDTIKFKGSVTNTTLLTEGFENEVPPKHWELDDDGNWGKKYSDWPENWSGNSSMIAANTGGFTNAVLATPMVKLSGNDVLSFYANAGNLSIGNTSMDIVYSKDKKKWTQVGETINPTEEITLYSVDLSSIPNGNYYLGFRASGAGDGDYSTVLVLDHVIGPRSVYHKLAWEVKDGTNPVPEAKVYYMIDSGNVNELLTDDQGIAGTEIPEDARVDYTVIKNNYTNVTNHTTITGPDTLDIAMTSGEALWPVTFKLTNANTNKVMEDVQVTLGSKTQQTDTNGIAKFEVSAGSYNYSINPTGFIGETGTIKVTDSRITEEISLDPKFKATFTVVAKADSKPIQGAVIEVGDSTLTANADGNASVFLKTGTHGYTVTAENYENASGSISIEDADISETVEMVRETFEVKFSLTDTSDNSAVAGATVTLTGYGDTTSNSSGIATFSGIPYSTKVDYTVKADGYSDASGTIATIDKDTTFAVAMNPLKTGILPTFAEDLSVYPNPSSGNITINGNNITGAQVTIRNITGETMLQEELDNNNYNMDLSYLPKGVYLIEISKGNERATQKLIIE